MNLNIQRISGSTRRTSTYFKSSIYEGSQHASVENNFKALFGKQNQVSSQLTDDNAIPKNSQKVIFFEDIDIIFEDELQDNFYKNLVKLIDQSKVPIIVSGTNAEWIRHILGSGSDAANTNGQMTIDPRQMMLPFGKLKFSDEVDEIEEERFDSKLFVEFDLKPKSPEVMKDVTDIINHLETLFTNENVLKLLSEESDEEKAFDIY